MIDEEHITPQIMVLDVESTGKEKATDQIIELCLRFGLSLEAESRTWRIRPSIAIHPEASAIHGITARDVADCPLFSDIAPEILSLLTRANVIVGYNVAFDLDMLQAELARATIPPLDLAGKHVIDVLRLWHHVEPRTLVAAHQKFCGTALIDAHQAAADVAATARVLTAMLETFGLAAKSWSEIAAVSNPFANRSAWLGPSPHIQWDESGAVVFGFGKYKGRQVTHVDRSFLKWILAKDFPPHVKKICTVALERDRQFIDWITTFYPRPASRAPETTQNSLSEQEAVCASSAQEHLL
jgi:DNA polymerase-3 subunit epsilon